MAIDGLQRITQLRQRYQAQEAASTSEVVRELREVKTELKVLNDMNENLVAEKITSATNSPYLPDQIWYKKEVVFGSPEESKWQKPQDYKEDRDQVSRESIKKLLSAI